MIGHDFQRSTRPTMLLVFPIHTLTSEIYVYGYNVVNGHKVNIDKENNTDHYIALRNAVPIHCTM